ncbi:stress-response A/B barrel domain-containing protein UP3-like [Alnus glutinosa]|uniref:stress-response A/B barrel domain-containing protein UP3-like n=1 Tax=Alnus glutinosa TaxID=3517 RepID=UPI002D7997A2|nr:stress-response A/B barrel domain-containing protein UP3-like [Alnus glutinosa]
MLRPKTRTLALFPSIFPNFLTGQTPSHPNLHSIKMSSQTQTQTIEHVVLFKVKENADPSQVDAWLHALNGLISLDQVLHLSASSVFRNRTSSSLSFTHILHSRYSSQNHLAAYSAHPNHVSVVKEYQPLIEDIMAVDWVFVADDLHVAPPPPGSAIRVTSLKLKDNLGDDVKAEILGGIKGIKDRFGEISQFTFGENFSPGRAKGFSVAWLSVFPGRSELEKVDGNEDLVILEEKVRAFVENEVVVDFVVPSPKSASV